MISLNITMTCRLRHIIRRSPLIVFGCNVGEDPQAFFGEVYKIVHAMGVTFMDKAQLALHQLKDIAQVWYTQWKDNRPVKSGLIEWEEFKEAFLRNYFPREKREVKIKGL